MTKHWTGKIVRSVRWVLVALLVLYVLLVAYRIPVIGEQKKTEAALAHMRSQNVNDVRDDVRLAITTLYPGSARVRAAELQYALAEQAFITDVFNAETWKLAAQHEGRAYQCLGATYSENLATLKSRVQQIRALVFNTPEQRSAYDDTSKFTTSFVLEQRTPCDVDPSTLSN